MAHLSVRELWVPGLLKRWVIQGEPYELVAPSTTDVLWTIYIASQSVKVSMC